MSVNMENMTDDVEYSDHEVQNISALLTGISPGDEADTFTRLEPLGQRGLDPNEVAELVALYRIVAAPNGETEVDLMINGSKDESPSNAAGNITTGFLDGAPEDANGNNQGPLANYMDNGVLDTGAALNDPDPITATNQSGYFVNFRSEFGSGPYVDANDDLGLHIEFDVPSDAPNSETMQVIYRLYWHVVEVSDGIPEFGSPARR